MLTESKWLTVKEAAEIIGVVASRIYQMVADEELHCERFGKTLAFRESDVIAFSKRPRPRGNPNFKRQTKHRTR